MSIILTTKRRIVQIGALIALNTNFWAFARLNGCLPVMNCEACTVAWLGCPVGMMARSIAFLEFPIVAVLFVLGIGLIVGRLFCGWVCPMGLLFDMLHKIPVPKIRLPHFLTWFKYAFLVLGVFVVVYLVGGGYEHNKLFFCNYCPTAALDVVIPDMIKHQDYYMDSRRILKFSVLGIVLVMATVNHRSFCKVMCPIGAMTALTNKFSFLSLKLNKHKCIECGKCNKDCPMDVSVMETREGKRSINRSPECIECLNCEQTCPVKAISNNSHIIKRN